MLIFAFKLHKIFRWDSVFLFYKRWSCTNQYLTNSFNYKLSLLSRNNKLYIQFSQSISIQWDSPTLTFSENKTYSDLYLPFLFILISTCLLTIYLCTFPKFPNENIMNKFDFFLPKFHLAFPLIFTFQYITTLYEQINILFTWL